MESFRTYRQDLPRGYCRSCNAEQYAGDMLPAQPGAIICGDCKKEAVHQRQQSMTLQELSTQYRREATVLRSRIVELRQKQRAQPDSAQRTGLEGRIRPLEEMWRENRDIAVLLERYYERGYRRNGRYTL